MVSKQLHAATPLRPNQMTIRHFKSSLLYTRTLSLREKHAYQPLENFQSKVALSHSFPVAINNLGFLWAAYYSTEL